MGVSWGASTPCPPADVHALRTWLRDRRPRPRPSANDCYTAVFAIVLVGATLRGLVAAMRWPLWPTAPWWCAPAGCLLVGGLASAVSWLVGPVGIDGAEAFWLWAQPVDRAALARRPFVRCLSWCLVTGTASAVATWALWGTGWPWLVVIASAVVAGGVVMVLPQAHRVPASRITVLALVVLLADVALTTALPLLGAVVALTTALVVVVAAWRCLGQVTRFAAAGPGRQATALGGALRGVDLGLLLDLVGQRTTVGTRRRVRGCGRGAVAVAVTDVRRLMLRGWPQLGALVLADVLLGLCCAVAGTASSLVPLALVVPLALMLTSVRTLQRSAGLRRLFGTSWQTDLPAATGALVVALGNALPVGLLLGGIGGLSFDEAVGTALTTAVVGWVAAVRCAASPRPDFATGLVMTEAGAVPLGAMLGTLRGVDVALGYAVACQLAVPGWIVAGCLVAHLLWQRGTMWRSGRAGGGPGRSREGATDG